MSFNRGRAEDPLLPVPEAANDARMLMQLFWMFFLMNKAYESVDFCCSIFPNRIPSRSFSHSAIVVVFFPLWDTSPNR